MIILDDVYKRYTVEHAPGKWILQGVSLSIPSKACVGLVGNQGSGKSTLLRLIAGTESATGGKIERSGRIATPTRYNLNLQPLLSGRQNAKFICRINGYAEDMEDRLARIEQLTGLGAKFDKPVGTYTPPMKLSLSFALSMAFDFDMYISDDFNFSGEFAFKDKDAASAALKSLTEHAGIIMTTKGSLGEATLKRYCKAGIWLHEGKAKWFDSISDAIEAYRASLPPVRTKGMAIQQILPVPVHAQPIMAKIKRMQNTLTAFSKGLGGSPLTINEKEIPRMLQFAKDIGMELVTTVQASGRGYKMREDIFPILYVSGAGGQRVEYFDLMTQFERIDSSK